MKIKIRASKPLQAENGLTAVVDHQSTKSGKTALDMTFLQGWLGSDVAAEMAGAIASYMAGKKSGSAAYAVRKVLKFWAISVVDKKLANWPSTPYEWSQLLLTLRENYYTEMAGLQKALLTIGYDWRQFLGFIFHLSALGIIQPGPHLRVALSVPMRLIRADKEDVLAGHADVQTIPRSMGLDEDAFHLGIMEPISLAVADEQYIEAYENQLSAAIGVVRSCAEKEIHELRRDQRLGADLIAENGYQILYEKYLGPNARKGGKKFLDDSNGRHVFSVSKGHPDALKNLLLVVVNEMGGLPSPGVKSQWVGDVYKDVVTPGAYHWRFMKEIGKNRLLRHLGVMTARDAAPFIVLILLEHPNLTVSALLRAKLLTTAGNARLLTTEGVDEVRLTLEKPRAKSYKSVVLTPRSRSLVDSILNMTRAVRKHLQDEGRHEDASYLWIGMLGSDYRVERLSEKTLTSALRLPSKFRSLGKAERRDRAVSFVDTHPELFRWSERLTYKSLRKSAGLLVYLQTKGDLVATAKAFGHKSAQTTIDSYVPRYFQLGLYERKIRRHQNLLIGLSTLGRDNAAEFTDFRDHQELVQFFGSLGMSYESLSSIRKSAASAEVAKANTSDRRLIFNANIRGLAIAILYCEHLLQLPRKVPSHILSDGTTPEMWIDVIGALRQGLPDAMEPLRQRVSDAESMSRRIRNCIQFPEYA